MILDVFTLVIATILTIVLIVDICVYASRTKGNSRHSHGIPSDAMEERGLRSAMTPEALSGCSLPTTKEAPVSEEYAGR